MAINCYASSIILSGIYIFNFSRTLPDTPDSVSQPLPHWSWIPDGLPNHHISDRNLWPKTPAYSPMFSPYLASRKRTLLLITNIDGTLHRSQGPSSHLPPLPITCFHNEAPMICNNIACFHLFHLTALLVTFPCCNLTTTARKPPLTSPMPWAVPPCSANIFRAAPHGDNMSSSW